MRKVRPYIIQNESETPGATITQDLGTGEQAQLTNNSTTRIVEVFLKLPRLAFLGIWYTLASETFGALEQIVWYSLGIFWVVDDRRIGHQLMSAEQKEEENTFGFGQLVPILLLILPLVQFAESYAGESLSKRNKTPLKAKLNEISSF